MRLQFASQAWFLRSFIGAAALLGCGDESSQGGSNLGGGGADGGGGSSDIGGMGTSGGMGGSGGSTDGGGGASGGMGGSGGMGMTCAECDPLAECSGEPPVTCTCPAGYTDSNGDGTACAQIDECAEGTDNCDLVATCTDSDGSFSCECPPGYTNPNGDGTLCSNIDECAEMLAMCDPLVGICSDNSGSFECSCPAGYNDTNADGSLCTDIDECAENVDTCDPLATCTNDVGSFSCTCPAGYVDTNGDGSLCTDIDECAQDVDNCDPLATCTNEPGTFTCSCPAEGYFDLNADGTLCEPLDLYYFSPFRNFLFQMDLDTNTQLGCVPITDSAGMVTIAGVTAAHRHPITGVVYAIAKINGVEGRALGTIDMATGVFTQIGPTGLRFSTLQWSNDGAMLYAVTGNGSPTNPESLFSLDPATGTPTLVQALGNGADGEAVAFDPAGNLFHWSGNSTVVMETVQIGTGVTNVTYSGNPGGETFGATWWNWHKDVNGDPDPVMLLGNIASGLVTLKPDLATNSAVYTPYAGSLRDDARGLIFDRNFNYPVDDSVCPLVAPPPPTGP